ncbi:MAG: hypothetical protein ACO24O_07200 [Arenimonas sp.]
MTISTYSPAEQAAIEAIPDCLQRRIGALPVEEQEDARWHAARYCRSAARQTDRVTRMIGWPMSGSEVMSDIIKHGAQTSFRLAMIACNYAGWRYRDPAPGSDDGETTEESQAKAWREVTE